MKAKILIIGGGVMGTSIAQQAAQRTDPLKSPVVLLEKGTIGAGSSGRSGAILRQHYADRQVAAMARESLREYAAFEARTGRSIGFRRSGVLMLAGPDQKDWIERIKTNVAMLAEMGVETSVLGNAEIQELFPGIQLAPGSVAAWEPDAGFVDPHRTLDAFSALARNYGAVTRVGVEVTNILVENGRVVGAETTEGAYDAEKVVVVAGPWSSAVLRKVGIELPLRVVRPESLFLSMPESETEEVEEDDDAVSLGFDVADDPADRREEPLAPRGLHPVLIDLENQSYCRCEPALRRSRVGRTNYEHDEVLEDPDTLVDDVDAAMRSWGHSVVTKRLPNYDAYTDAGGQAAWYTLTPDAQAIIGPAPGIEGLYIVSGFSGHGFKLAPSVGEGVAQMLFDEPVSAFEPEFFSPTRFQGNEDWSGAFGL